MTGGIGSNSYKVADAGVRASEDNYRSSMYHSAAQTRSVEAQGIGGAGQRKSDAERAYLADVKRRQALGAQMGQFQGQQDRVIGYLSGVANGRMGQGAQAFQQQQADAMAARTRAALANRTAGAAAMRQAQNANDAQAVQGIMQGQAIRAQEQEMAQAQLANYLAQGRGAAMDYAQLESDRAAAYRQASQQGDLYRARTEQALGLQDQAYFDTSRDRAGDMQMQYWQGIKAHNDRVRKERETRGFQAVGAVTSLAGEIL